LLQLYKYDFSEFAPIGSPYGEVDEEGLFAYPGLESYWQDSGRIPLLIRADDHLAGFALVNQWSALGLPLDHAVAEFFVMRKYRRARVGTRAALWPLPRPMGGGGGLVQPARFGVLAQGHRRGGSREGRGDRRRRATLDRPGAVLRHGLASAGDTVVEPRCLLGHIPVSEVLAH
jgi:hypothetical protein